jgi:hypothetical protein
MRTRWFALALLLACAESQPQPCDPLAAHEAPITLGPILAVGRQADGTLIAVDKAGSENRVFVSQAGTLARQRVNGFGSGNDASGTWLQFSLGSPNDPWALRVEMSSAGTRMGVVRGPLQTKTFVIGEMGESLAVVGPEVLQGLPVHNLAGDVFVEYLGSVEDGRRLVVLRPADDWSYEDFRLFLGGDQLIERKVSQVTRARDGGTTDIQFDLDGATATAHFPSALTGGTTTLTAAGRALTITTQAPGTRPEGVSFLCR